VTQTIRGIEKMERKIVTANAAGQSKGFLPITKRYTVICYTDATSQVRVRVRVWVGVTVRVGVRVRVRVREGVGLIDFFKNLSPNPNPNPNLAGRSSIVYEG
jgi:hypothetical protein